MDNDDIRSKLSELLRKSQQKLSFEELISYVEDLHKIYPNEIQVVGIGDIHSSCFNYAFKLTGNMKTPTMSLVKQNNLVKELSKNEEVKPDDLIIYQIKSVVAHIGVVIAKGVVESKWETGPIIKHSPLMVPRSYGSDYKYYRILDKKGVINYLRQYKLN